MAVSPMPVQNGDNVRFSALALNTKLTTFLSASPRGDYTPWALVAS